MRRTLITAVVAAVALVPSQAHAQLGVTPLLTGPDVLARGNMQLGGYVTIEEEIDVFGIYRQGFAPSLDLGARLGYTSAGEGGVHLGGDVRYGAARSSEEFPLDLAVVAGLQLSIADSGELLQLPFGASLGREVGTSERPIVVYGAPYLRVVHFIPEAFDSETELEFTLELGTQIGLAPHLHFDGALLLNTDDDDEVGLALGIRWKR